MTNPNCGNIPISSHEQYWPTTATALAVGKAFYSVVLGSPQWLGFRVEMAGAAQWRWLAVLPSVLGFAVALRCVWDFGWTGPGTLAPIAPRNAWWLQASIATCNPMYVGFAVGWIELWIVFGHANLLSIAAVAAVALLSADDQIFITAFVRSHGQIKEMERVFGVSYPTIKSRLTRIANSLEFVHSFEV